MAGDNLFCGEILSLIILSDSIPWNTDALCIFKSNGKNLDRFRVSLYLFDLDPDY